MSKHTKGPWRYEQRGTQIWGRSVGGCQMIENDHLIADVRGWGHIQYLTNGEEIQDANGLLIAAAPDLLESAKLLIDSYDICRKDRTPDVIFERLRAAIAKATGETL